MKTRARARASAEEQQQLGAGKENVCPLDGGRGIVGSPLPDGYPRKPLQDITQALSNQEKGTDSAAAAPRKKNAARKGHPHPQLVVVAAAAAEEKDGDQVQSKRPHIRIEVQEEIACLEVASVAQIRTQSPTPDTIETRKAEPEDHRPAEATATEPEDSTDSSPRRKRRRVQTIKMPAAAKAAAKSAAAKAKSATAAAAAAKPSSVMKFR